MEQISFLITLYIIGLLFSLLFHKQVNIVFLCATAFLWGTLLISIVTILLMSIGIPYTFTSFIAIQVGILIIIALIHVWQQSWKLTKVEVVSSLISVLAFIFVIIVFSHYNISYGTPDSVEAILTGRTLATFGFQVPTDLITITHYGILLSLLHSFSYFLHTDYLYILQAALAFTIITAFIGVLYAILQKRFTSKLYVWLVIIANLMLFLSSGFVLLQLTLISSIDCAVMFFPTAIGCFWLAYEEDQTIWAMFGVLSLIGYAISRIESPLIALAILTVMLKKLDQRKKTIKYLLLAYLTIMLAWSLQWLRLEISNGNTPYDMGIEYFLLLVGVHIGLLIVLLLPQGRLKKLTQENMGWVTLAMLSGVILYLAFHNGHNLLKVFHVLADHIYSKRGLWGITWIILTITMVISLFLPRIPNGFVFTHSITGYLLCHTILAYMNMARRTDTGFYSWIHSSNRMLFIVLPVIMLYVTLKFSRANSDMNGKVVQPETPPLSKLPR